MVVRLAAMSALLLALAGTGVVATGALASPGLDSPTSVMSGSEPLPPPPPAPPPGTEPLPVPPHVPPGDEDDACVLLTRYSGETPLQPCPEQEDEASGCVLPGAYRGSPLAPCVVEPPRLP